MKRQIRKNQGFTLIELLLVLTIVGLMMVLILPRAMRANTESKFSLIRQYGSEIASKIMTWAEGRARSQRSEASFTVRDFLYSDILPEDNAGFVSRKLDGKYTGSDDFNGVESLLSPHARPRNPFNETDYFARVNDDSEIPSNKQGLLYFSSQKDASDPDFRAFYLCITSAGKGPDGSHWYAGMDPTDPDTIRNGIFVARLYDDQDPGRPEPGQISIGGPAGSETPP